MKVCHNCGYDPSKTIDISKLKSEKHDWFMNDGRLDCRKCQMSIWVGDGVDLESAKKKVLTEYQQENCYRFFTPDKKEIDIAKLAFIELMKHFKGQEISVLFLKDFWPTLELNVDVARIAMLLWDDWVIKFDSKWNIIALDEDIYS